MKTAMTDLKERIVALSSGEDEMVRTKDLLDAITIYQMFERSQIVSAWEHGKNSCNILEGDCQHESGNDYFKIRFLNENT